MVSVTDHLLLLHCEIVLYRGFVIMSPINPDNYVIPEKAEHQLSTETLIIVCISEWNLIACSFLSTETIRTAFDLISVVAGCHRRSPSMAAINTSSSTCPIKPSSETFIDVRNRKITVYTIRRLNLQPLKTVIARHTSWNGETFCKNTGLEKELQGRLWFLDKLSLWRQ